MESTAVDNVVYTLTTEYFKYIRDCVYNSKFCYISTDMYKLYKHVRCGVHKRWRVQQSITLYTLITTEYFKYIRGCVYKSIFSYLPDRVYKLYKHVRRRVHRRWIVQQSTTSYKLVTTGYFKYIRGCVYNSTIFFFSTDVYKLYKHVRKRVHRRWKIIVGEEHIGGGEYSS